MKKGGVNIIQFDSMRMFMMVGSVSVNHSVGSWINGINVFKATSKAKLYVHLGMHITTGFMELLFKIRN